jgi:hypothetical protein
MDAGEQRCGWTSSQPKPTALGGDSLIDLEADQPIGIKNIFLASL